MATEKGATASQLAIAWVLAKYADSDAEASGQRAYRRPDPSVHDHEACLFNRLMTHVRTRHDPAESRGHHNEELWPSRTDSAMKNSRQAGKISQRDRAALANTEQAREKRPNDGWSAPCLR